MNLTRDCADVVHRQSVAIECHRSVMKAIYALTTALIALLVGVAGCESRLVIEEQPVEYDRSPLIWMLRDASLEEFELAVREHPEWIDQKSRHLPDEANKSPLTAALLLGLTNHVNVLLRHGADVREAERWCKQYDFPEGIDLLNSVCEELERQKQRLTTSPRPNAPDH